MLFVLGAWTALVAAGVSRARADSKMGTLEGSPSPPATGPAGPSPSGAHATGIVDAPDPDAPTVVAHADKTEAHVGDPIHLDVVAISKTAVPVNLPSTIELGASRCSTARRASRTWATGA